MNSGTAPLAKNVGIVGCGYVSAFYMATSHRYPDLKFVAAFDIDRDRLQKFSSKYSIRPAESLHELIEKCDLVVNLTTPESHFEVSRICLENRKSVYSEKPVTLSNSETQELVQIATKQNVNIFSAPCVHLSAMAETVNRAIEQGLVGDIYAVYAEMDNDLVHLKQHESWRNEFGIGWPAKNEFESGATLEHAAYTLCLLRKWFGPGQLMCVHNSVAIPEKIIPLHKMTADISFAIVEYADNIVARLTCSIVAPRNHEIKIYGERGVITVEDIWFFDTPVYFQKYITPRKKPRLSPFKRRLKSKNDGYPLGENKDGSARMDFLRGVFELSQRVGSDIEIMKSMSEVNEIVLSMNGPSRITVQRPWIIVGTGLMADRMCRSLKQNGYRVDAVYSGTSGRAHQFADSHQINECYGELVDIPTADGRKTAYVASLNTHHYAQVKALLLKGYHVLCEKPLTLDPTTTAELFDLAKSQNLILQENLWSLFVPAAAEIKNAHATSSGAELSFCSTIEFEPGKRQWDVAEGGCIYDLAIYPISWGIYLFGEVASFALENAVVERGVIAEVSLTTYHSGGKRCHIKAGFYTDEHDIKIGNKYYHPIYCPEHRFSFTSPLLRKVQKKLRPPDFRSVDPYAHIVNLLNVEGREIVNSAHPPAASIEVSKLLHDLAYQCSVFKTSAG